MTKSGASVVIRRLIAFCFFSLAQVGWSAVPSKQKFNIPESMAEKSLKLLSVQSGRQVLFPTDAVEGVRTKPIAGEMTAADALSKMLEGTSLVGVEDNKTGSLTVRRASSPSDGKKSARNAGQARDGSARDSLKKNEIETTPPTQEPMKKNRFFAALAATFALLTAPAEAQIASTASNSGTPSKEAIELSPFVVKTDRDTGYLAQNSLAGSRLNTRLKDVATPVTVFTEEFLNDIAVTDLEELLEYAPNVDLDREEAVNGGDTTGGSLNEPFTYRIRGLPSSGRAYNYFAWTLDQDMYNIGRVDFSRGPNSILFGLGSPSGLLNVTTKQAGFGRNRGSVSLRFDDSEVLRSTLDYNQVLIPDRLAVRLNLLAEGGKTWRDHLYRDQLRGHLTATWRATKNTTIRAEYERGKTEQYKTRPWLAMDLDRFWRNFDRPTHTNFVGGTGAWSNPNQNPNNAVQTLGGAVGRPYGLLSGVGWFVINTDSGKAFNMRQMARTTQITGRPALLPGELPVPMHAVPTSPDLGQDIRYNTQSVYLEHQVTDDFFIELAYNRQHSTFDARDIIYTYFGYIGDPNEYLPDRTPNPDVGRYYLENAHDWRTNEHKSDDFRITASYSLDFTERSKWLGRHNLAGLYEEYELANRRTTAEEFLTNGPSKNLPENSNNRIYRRNYVSSSTVGGAAPIFGNIRWNGLDNHEFLRGVTFTDHAGTSITTDSARFTDGGSSSLRNLDSKMFVLQSYWLKERLITTFGYREDSARFDTGATNLRAAPSGPTALYAVGERIIGDPDGTNATHSAGITRTFGVVGHVLPWLSVFYNQSTNFAPAPDRNIYPDNEPAPNPNGDGKDYGIKLDLFGNKLYANLIRYETSAVRDTGNLANVPRTHLNRIYQELDLRGELAAMGTSFDEVEVDATGMLVDAVSEGYEVEIVANPTPNWRVSLAGSRNFSVQSKMGIEVLDYMKNFEATYVTDDRLRYVFGGDPAADLAAPPTMNIGPLGSPTEGGGDLGVLPANSVSRSLSEARRWIFNTIRAADGAQQFGQRKYGIRFFNNYRIPSGPLRGFGIGGGVRWQSPNVAGYTSADPATRELLLGRERMLVDLTLSYRRKLTDRLDWSIQLNIKNLLDNDDVIITKMHREFQGRFLEQPEIKQYFFENPRRILLTNTISF